MNKIGPGNDLDGMGIICKRYNLMSVVTLVLANYELFIDDENHHEIEPHFRPQYILHNYVPYSAYLGRFEDFKSINNFMADNGLI